MTTVPVYDVMPCVLLVDNASESNVSTCFRTLCMCNAKCHWRPDKASGAFMPVVVTIKMATISNVHCNVKLVHGLDNEIEAV